MKYDYPFSHRLRFYSILFFPRSVEWYKIVNICPKWETIKDFYENQGETGIQGSRDAIRMAFKRGLIVEGEIWMKMIKSRVLTSHTYNEDTADKIVMEIGNVYYHEFLKLHETFTGFKKKAQTEK